MSNNTLDKQITTVQTYVIKRNGKIEEFSFDKILRRIKTLCNVKGEPPLRINPTSLCIKIFDQLVDNITTKQIDILSASHSFDKVTEHPDYKKLAARIIISNHQKSTFESFSRTMYLLYENKDTKGNHKPLLSDEFIANVRKNHKQYDKMIRHERDYLIDYFGFKTLEKSYLMQINGVVVERIQHLWMRVAVALHGDNLEKVEESYNLFSQKYMTHATPTLFNAGTRRQQMSSCFLVAMKDDSIKGIFSTLADCAEISKWAGGIGIHIHNIRAKNSPIYGTNGKSNGIVPMLRVYNATAKYVDQCFHPDTPIYTDSGIIAISSLIENHHKVYGADEQLHTVTKVLAHHDYNGELLHIELENGIIIRVTPEHPIFAKFSKEDVLVGRDLYEWPADEKYSDNNWIPVGKLSVGDFVYQSIINTPLMITKIESEHYEGTLYDLEVADEHNYKIHGAIGHNGGGKRHGSFAIYIEPWHADIEDFLELRKNHGSEDMKARDLFYALWTPDLFMKRVQNDEYWTLMCPLICTGLSDVYGDEFESLYVKYETEGLGIKKVKARELWKQIMDAQMETGTPYLLFKDHANKKSNQKNVGIIKSSNLCTEIMEISTPDETAVCNLASIALPSFVIGNATTTTTDLKFDYNKLHEVVKIATYNLNRVIDINYYPIESAKKSNMKMRPIGIGVQGLADVYFKMKIPFNSNEAKQINRRIFETIYHAALEQSMELAKLDGPYECFPGSPASQGILQFDLWHEHNTKGMSLPSMEQFSPQEWQNLKNDIIQYGLRNSLLVAPMPTASTSQILGYNECFEPITSNIYTRKVNAGTFIITNDYMIEDLISLGLWNDTIRNRIVADNGSIQSIAEIPEEIKNRYLTVWEISMRDLIDMSAERGQYICQSQSLNLFMKSPTYEKMNAMHFYSWKRGLKTGMYYLRSNSASKAQQITVEPVAIGAGSAATSASRSASCTKNKNSDNVECESCSA
jgi:ribonucleoside-diphosphate reductase alpha subunit